MSLRDLALDTLARTPDRAAIAGRWRRLSYTTTAFSRLLAVEGCASELVSRLRELDLADALPPELGRELAARAHRQASGMLAVGAQLHRLLGHLRGAGVDVTLLKGAAFLRTRLRPYRQCNDLDLLIADTAALEGTIRLLLSLGYRVVADEDGGGAEHHLRPFVKEGEAPVELHSRPLARGDGRAGGGAAWATAQLEDGVRILAPSDWCWHTMAHDAFHHETAGCVRSALDLASLVERFGSKIDWDRVGARAREWPDPTGPLLLSVRRLGYEVPLPARRSTRFAVALAGAGREYASRAARRDALFAFAVRKISGLAFTSPSDWVARRRGGIAGVGAPAPALARDVVRLLQVMLGRDVA